MTVSATLGQTIVGDLEWFGGWLEEEVVEAATAAWTDFKSLFVSLTAEQYAIFKSLVAEVQADQAASMGVEGIVADVLTLAGQKEVAWVAGLPGQVLVAVTALASQELAAIAPSVKPPVAQVEGD